MILVAAIAALACGQCAAPGLAAEPAKKLHLMYLVTAKADDLKPGSVVAVEPAFFTDGERIVFAYDYCRAYRAFINGAVEENQPLLALKKQKKLAGDLPSLELWCRRHDPKLEPSWSIRDEENEPFNAEANSMVGMDNEGGTIQLSSLEFVNYHKAGKGILTQIVPPKNGSAIPPGRRQYRFFLMSSNLQALKTVLPVWRVKNKQSQALFNRLDSIMGKVPDSIQPLCGSGNNALYWCEARSITVFDRPEVKILSALLAKDDLDVDVILAVGLQTSVPLGDAAGTQVLWRGLNFLFASGPHWVRADAMKVSDLVAYSDRIDSDQVGMFLPKIAVRIAQCNYIATSAHNLSPGTLHMIPLPILGIPAAPGPSAQCNMREAIKHRSCDDEC